MDKLNVLKKQNPAVYYLSESHLTSKGMDNIHVVKVCKNFHVIDTKRKHTYQLTN